MPKTLRSSLLTFGGAGFLLCLLYLTVRGAPTAQTVTPGIIQGRVTDVDHQPLANIVVSVMPYPLAGDARTRTLADGSYQLAVSPGTYLVFMMGAELYPTPQVYVAKYYPNAVAEKTAQPVTVTSDAVVDHIDVQLDRYGVIEGTVSDEHGQPLSQLQVKLYGQESDTSTILIPYSSPKVTTDAQGHYHVPELGAGVYKLFFVDPHTPPQVQGEFLGHTTVLTTAQEINVHLNQLVANVNISLTHKTDVAPFRLRQLVTTPLFPNFLLAVNTAEQLIYSRDGGHKWLHATTPVTPVLPAIALRTSVTSPIRLLFAANDSIYRTGDWGVSWAKQLITPHPECDTPTTIIALASQPTQPTHVFGYATCEFRSLSEYIIKASNRVS